MKKSLPKYLLSGALVALTATSGWAGSTLEEQVQALSRQNQAQSELLRELQKKMGTQEEQSKDNREGGLLQAINDHVDLSALVEVEAGSAEAFDQSDSSDIALATVEIHLHAQMSEWSSGHILLKYEEGEEDDHLFIDEGIITLGNMEKFPLMLMAGKMYVPFGSYTSNMISDPLTLEIGETNDSAVQILTEINGFYTSAYIFNGKTDETGEDDKVKTFGANAGFTMSSDGFGLDVGIDWLNNLADSNGLADHISTTTSTIDDMVDGLSIHATVEVDDFIVTGEYVAALDNFATGEVDFKGQGAKPEAYNLEAAYGMEIAGRATTFALGHQATDEALDLGLPESRYIGAVSVELFPSTALTIEYFHDEDYDTSDGGTGDDANTMTMQLALEF